MLKLAEKNLDTLDQNNLADLQEKVNKGRNFTEKVLLAKTLWQSKGSNEGKESFNKIASLLAEMCVFIKTCNYCEGNEAHDIEHIYPKSFFPENAFQWNNYILACKQCNTGYKLDKCHVLDVQGNLHSTNRGNEPLHKIVAIVNPRIEDPNDFFWLNMSVGKFEVFDNLSKANKNKAEKTLDILALNTRDYLVEGRKKTLGELFDKMDRLCRILKVSTIIEIENILAPYHGIINTTLPIEILKNQLTETTKRHIQKQLHPSVWYTIKTILSKTEPRWQRIFEVIPAALNW
jgi:uncharacterized protein (TIGR02646 family)